jgi:hypothetical protein
MSYHVSGSRRAMPRQRPLRLYPLSLAAPPDVPLTPLPQGNTGLSVRRIVFAVIVIAVLLALLVWWLNQRSDSQR